MTNHQALTGACPAARLPLATAIRQWLASAHPSPATGHAQWDSDTQIALLPLGRLFDAVRLPEDLVHRVAGLSDPVTVNAWLGWSLNSGPVIHDPGGRRYYALVPPGTAPHWRAPAAACLGTNTYLGVPRPDLTRCEEHGARSYWAVPLTRPGRLCRTSDVLTFAMVAGCLTDEEDDEAQS